MFIILFILSYPNFILIIFIDIFMLIVIVEFINIFINLINFTTVLIYFFDKYIFII